MTGVPIEARGVLAAYDAESGRLTVWSSTQVPFTVRAAIADALGLPEASIRVIAPDVGGGFGVKGHVYPEDVLIPARGPPPGPAGEVGRDAARALPHRLRRS